MGEVLRDYGMVAARISTYGLDEDRVARLQHSAFNGDFVFLQQIHSLALQRDSQESFRLAVDRHYGFNAGPEAQHVAQKEAGSLDVVSVMSPGEFAVLHMNGGGLSKTGMFTSVYWSKNRTWKKPSPGVWTSPIVSFRSTTLEDLENPNLKYSSFPTPITKVKKGL